jgi:hypothetical protein
MRLFSHLMLCGMATSTALALAAAAPSGGAAPEPAASTAAAIAAAAGPGKAGEAPPGQPVTVAASDLSSLNRLLPVGKTARRVTVPTVNEEGVLTSLVTMGAITRLDDENFLLEDVVLTSFGRPTEEGTTSDEATIITLISGRYHAPTRFLHSDQEVSIRKPGLVMTGDSLQYDSAAGIALMKGKTKALITDAPSPAPDSPPAKSAAPQPTAPPQ